MTEKFIAIAPKGKEFMFDATRSIAVPKSSASKIVDVLNELKYMIKNDNETWWIYDNDWYYNSLIMYQIKRYGNRMPVYNYYG